ncbi:MAG: formate--phosphoribosylaminoimidazolecarboxamide ligase [Nitrososphaerota archaeon]
MNIVKSYDPEKISVATLASHTALQILLAAHKHGFRTIALSAEANMHFYKSFSFIDEVWPVTPTSLEKMDSELISRNAVIIPHGSMVEYFGPSITRLRTPIFGNRHLIDWERNQMSKMKLLREAGIPTPRTYSLPSEANVPAIVKLYGAKGGRGYFLARNREELALKCSTITEPYIIQEYVIGVPAYYHYFSSKMRGRIEIFGADIRYETNVDGRIPGLADPTFVVVGNLPLTLRESLLPKILKYGEAFAEAVERNIPPGLIGPYCLESIIRDDMEIVVFEYSGRIVAGTNVYAALGSPYSALYFGKPIDMGERIALEIEEAAAGNRLEDITT